MKYIYILLLLLPLSIYSQSDVEILNDSTFVLSFDKVNSIKERTENLKAQIKVLSEYVIVCDTATKKAINKEMWYNQEVEKWAKMDSIMREKITLSNGIMNNYKSIIILTEEQLKSSEKDKKKQERWKNIYKFPAIIGVTTLSLLLILR